MSGEKGLFFRLGVTIVSGVAASVFGPPARAAEAPAIIAVFPLEDATGKLSVPVLDSLSDYLASRVGRIPGFSIIPRGDLHARLAQQKADSYKSCVDQSCQIEIGKELAASKVLAARLTAIGSGCILSTYIFDLARATTDSTATVRIGCDEDAVLTGLDQLVAQFEREQKDKAGARLAILVGKLYVSSTPAGGTIALDGADSGKTTPALLEDVPSGQHRIVVETDEAEGQANAEVSAGSESRVEVILRTRPARLSVSTSPEGAEILLAGKVVGSSPLTVEVPRGSVVIEARARNGAMGRATVNVQPSRTPQQVSIPLLEVSEEAEKVEGSGAGGVLLAVGGVALIGGGVVLDVTPSSAHNGRFDALDMVPVGLYVAGAIVAALGFGSF